MVVSGFSAEPTGVGRIDVTRLCRIFVAVAEHRSFGLAADYLGLSQPSVSQSIRRFEAQIGFEVFRRTRDGAVLSEEGRQLLPLARVVVRDVDSFELAATQLASDRDSISIGVGLAAPAWVAAAAARAASSLATRVVVERGADSALIEKVETGELSAVIVEFPSPLGDLVKGVGHVAERRLAIPEGRASAVSTRTPWSEVSGLDLAITPRALGPAAWDQLTDRLTDAAGPRTITEVEATDHLLPAVAGRTCFAVVDASATALPGTMLVPLPATFSAQYRVLVHPDRQVAADGTDLRSVLDRGVRRANPQVRE